MFAQVVAMVTPENDNGIVRQTELIEGVKHSANLGVDKGYACIIRLHCLEAGQFIQAVVGNRTVMGKGSGGDIFPVIFRSIRKP